ncbi:MAG: DUF484 family protein [Methylococcaceae bacterium]
MTESNLEHTPEITEISAEQVEDFLSQHPNFFNNHLALLEKLTIPHPSGTAVSLLSKQLELFRDKHKELESQLISLIEIARENDSLLNRMHELTLAMLDASTFEEALINLEQVLFDCFQVDFVAVRIFQDNPDFPISNIYVAPTDPAALNFKSILSSNQPNCGKPKSSHTKYLFGAFCKDVNSCAIIPMNFTELEGILAIGSRQEDRFHPSMGHIFLTQMSRIIGTRFISLMRNKQ